MSLSLFHFDREDYNSAKASFLVKYLVYLVVFVSIIHNFGIFVKNY